MRGRWRGYSLLRQLLVLVNDPDWDWGGCQHLHILRLEGEPLLCLDLPCPQEEGEQHQLQQGPHQWWALAGRRAFIRPMNEVRREHNGAFDS